MTVMKPKTVGIVAVTVTRKPSPAVPPMMGTAEMRARIFLQFLRQEYPVMAEMLPLQVQINKKIQARLPAVSRRIVNMALYYHTSSAGYIESIVKGFGRFTLDKAFVENISPADRARAARLLKGMKQKMFKHTARTGSRKPNHSRPRLEKRA